MGSAETFSARSLAAPVEWAGAAVFRLLQALMVWPAPLFLLTFTAMLFRPPDLRFYGLDRIALGLLIAIVLLRALVLRQSLWLTGPVTWPMLVLVLAALVELLSAPYEPQNWSTFAAKYAVPFVLYHLAQLVFEDASSLRQLETYLLIVLGYLSFTAIFFLAGVSPLIFPSYILDESLGIHVDRARGPFLQAVANGVTLTLLGLVALDAYRRGRLRGFLAVVFVIALPLAVLATKTRSVWISFAGSILAVFFVASSPRIRRACAYLTGAGLLVLLFVFALAEQNTTLASRLQDRSPVEFRLSVYRAGWGMFLEKPLWGWTGGSIQPELSKRIDGFHQEQFFFHNSYLEVAVNHGLVGLGLYLWVLVDLLRVGRSLKTVSAEGHFLDEQFRSLWPVLVGVYVLNASFVVMNYQFVNGLLFTLAGILAAQNRRLNAQIRAFSL